MPGLYLPFVQRLFSDHDEVGRVAQRDLCDRVGFDDLQPLRVRLNLLDRRNARRSRPAYCLFGRI